MKKKRKIQKKKKDHPVPEGIWVYQIFVLVRNFRLLIPNPFFTVTLDLLSPLTFISLGFPNYEMGLESSFHIFAIIRSIGFKAGFGVYKKKFFS